jgi:hypothetical protein
MGVLLTMIVRVRLLHHLILRQSRVVVALVLAAIRGWTVPAQGVGASDADALIVLAIGRGLMVATHNSLKNKTQITCLVIIPYKLSRLLKPETQQSALTTD